MLLSEDLLIKMENAHQRKLSEKDKTALEAIIDSEIHLKQEVEGYKEIWQGFDALKSYQQAQLFQQWEQDWLVHDETELIEWYVNDELGEATTKKLNNKYKNNTEFATKVDSFKAIQGGFNSLKSEDFRTKMEKWQMPAQEQKRPVTLSVSWKRKLAIAASILLLISASFAWWSQDQVSNASLVAVHYQAPATGNNLSGETAIGDYLKAFAQAHFFMNEKEYPDAIKFFRSLKKQTQPTEWPESERKHYLENIEWNLLLALMANDRADEEFYKNLEKIATNTSHEYQGKAIELRKDLASFWRF